MESSLSVFDDFVQCFSRCCPSVNGTSPIPLIFTPSSPSYLPILNFSAQNPRYALPETPKPRVIITPVDVTQIQAAIKCAKKHGLQFIVRSGGHDFEGQSFIADAPFVLLDLFNLRSISIEEDGQGSATAWVQSGATGGEFMYNISLKSKTLGFPGSASSTPSLGIGGYISGGGVSTLSRKYGVAADTVIDALFIGADGNVLNKNSLDEDLFWAIRGGGGGNFGIVLAWKLNLVKVPEVVTVFKIQRTEKHDVSNLVYMWQSIAPTIDENLYLVVDFKRKGKSFDSPGTLTITFMALYLGTIDTLLPLMQNKFPQLDLASEDCKEMSWIESVAYLYSLEYNLRPSLDLLLSRQYNFDFYYKVKSEFVIKVIDKEGLKRVWGWLAEPGPWNAEMKWLPSGGRMAEIPETEIPYPHRKGNLYEVHLIAHWDRAMTEDDAFKWIRKLYHHMTPYVAENPRASYVNLRDLDLGRTTKHTTPLEASIWGTKYYKVNYERLVRVKTKVDPDNFFRNQQSIPPIPSYSQDKEE